jgi:4-amino-4-deoxy-L-arabinose transferase-like glycosyltransferase
MLSALIGAATVPALYVFARLSYGRATAIAAAALLAVYHLHVHYSRIGLNNVVDPLPALVAFTALLYGVRRASWLGFAGAGAALGLAMYFYMGARLAPLVVAVVLAHLLVVDRRRFRELAPRIALVPVGFVLVAGPLLRWFRDHPDALDARLKLVGLFQSGAFDDRRAAGESRWTS